MIIRLIYLTAISFLLVSCATTKPALNQMSEKHVGNFALLDHKGIFQELYYYSDKKAVVLIAQGNGCPILRRQINNIDNLRREFESQGVVFLMINANRQDDHQSIVEEANTYGIHLPILEDKTQAISQLLGLERIAQAVVIDPRYWDIVYSGAINDQYGYESQRTQAKNHYLKDVLKAILLNQPVVQNQTRPLGCLINFESAEKPTYVKDIAPILINRCIACHSTGGIAPWSMNRYETVKGWGSMIKEVLHVKRMPPWGADPSFRPVTVGFPMDSEKERLILQWIKEGMPRGEGDDPLLSLKEEPVKWPLGPPDLILSVGPQQIPAAGILEYRNIHMEQTVKEDQWVKAIYWKPGNRKVLHHAILYAQNNSKLEHPEWFYRSGLFAQEKGNVLSNANDMVHLFDTYVPGQQPFIVPTSTGLYLPKGTTFAFQMHYTTTGKPEEDNTQVGIYFYKKKPPQVLSLKFSYNHDVLIPPGDAAYKASSVYMFRKDSLLFAIRPHMHTRGRSVMYELTYPNGKKETILSIAHYRFLWQLRYIFKEPIKIPAGTTITARAVFDNSAQNTDNPNPNQRVSYGMLTENEMLGSMYYVAESP